MTAHRRRVGIAYPAEWDGPDAADLEARTALLVAVDPAVEVLECRYVDPEPLRAARGAGLANDELRARAAPLTDAQRDAFADIEVALAMDLPFDVASVAPRLRWVQAIGAGVGQLRSAGLAEAGIALTSAAGVNATAVAEFALFRLLAHWKQARALDDAQSAHRWRPRYGREVEGSTVCLLGLGHIGARVSTLLAPFGARQIAVRVDPSLPGPPAVERVLPLAELHTALGMSDAVIAAVPETATSIDVMDKAAFAAMPTGSFFCNVGRGSLVVEDALVAALQEGRLAGAALDVTRIEPLPASSPLWDAPNLALSAHCASSVGDHFDRVYRLFADNLARYLSGRPLRNEVTGRRGY